MICYFIAAVLRSHRDFSDTSLEIKYLSSNTVLLTGTSAIEADQEDAHNNTQARDSWDRFMLEVFLFLSCKLDNYFITLFMIS